MILNQHLELEGKHAVFGGSNWRWINYENDEDFIRALISRQATEIGTGVHSYARKHISRGFKVGNTKDAKNDLLLYLLEDCGIPEYAIDISSLFDNMRNYINDAVGFHMTPEVPIKFADNVFGTADALIFSDGTLRIHDLKTGYTPAHMEQLMIYAAFYCLEYRVKPMDISYVLRIYQNNEIWEEVPDPMDIQRITKQAARANSITLKLSGKAV